MKVNESQYERQLLDRIRSLTTALERAASALERSTSLTMRERVDAIGDARDVLKAGGR